MKNLLVILGICSLFACDTKTTSNQESNEQTTKQHPTQQEQMSSVELENQMIAELATINPNEYIGYYVGDFVAGTTVKEGGTYENKINISIDNIEGEKIKGHSIVAGNNRPFEGTFNATQLKAKVKEPGDDKYDGVFNFEFDDKGTFIVGTWEANDKKLKVTKRKYKLNKVKYVYDKTQELPENLGWADLYGKYDDIDEDAEFLTQDVLKHNASNKELQAKDIENMYKGDLEVLRNSIYARHGYSFKNRKMRYVFDHIKWYIPLSTDIRNQLTALEKKNIDLIKRYEGHAERYYDVFGR